MASFCLTACTDDEGKQSSGTNLTPDEHKEKLENIGPEVLGKINPADHEKLLNAIDNFARLADDGLDIERDKAIQSGVNLAKTMANICRRSNPGEMMSLIQPGRNDEFRQCKKRCVCGCSVRKNLYI